MFDPSMSFEERQRAWTGFQREFRQHNGRNERPTVWVIRVEGDRVYTQYGLLDGAMQTTNKQGKVKNRGKKNEISTEQDALAEGRRDCRDKWDKEGFDEYIPLPDGSLINIDNRNERVSITALVTNLPGSFCVYKPQNNLWDCKKLLALAEEGKVWYSLKRDGLAFWVVCDHYGTIQLYSRRSRPFHDKEGPKECEDGTLDFSAAIPWRLRFPRLEEDLKKLNLPKGTLLACELVAPQGDNFKLVSSYTKSYTEQSLRDQMAFGPPVFYVWDIVFFDGQDLLATEPYRNRMGKIQWLCQNAGPYIQPVQVAAFRTPKEAEAYAAKAKFEGWVVVDPEAVYGDKGWNLKGKPDRPSSCAKLKPRQEDDFIAYWDPRQDLGTWGSGRHERGKLVTLPNGTQVTHGGLGSVALYQYNSRGEAVYICDCSSGLDYETQANLKESDFPQVWQVEFVERTYISDGEKTNALRFPTFVRVRTDKTPQECVNERL
jgi:ATP-dependent DNA ligase